MSSIKSGHLCSCGAAQGFPLSTLFYMKLPMQMYVGDSLSFSPSVIEEAAPPLPASGVVHHIQENGVSTSGKVAPPVMEKPKRGTTARGIEDVRPSVESLLDELESSVPSPM